MKATWSTKGTKLAGRRGALLRSLGLMGVLFLGVAAMGADEAKEAKEAGTPTPEVMFEGGDVAYTNWIELSVGGFLTRGSQAQAEARHGMNDGLFGGISDFHLQDEVAKDTTFSMDGRALYDQGDYKLSLGVVNPEKGFVRFNVEQFRTWYNGDGGFYAPGDVWYPLSGDALAIDRGEISFEAGLTLEKKPQVTFKYSHLYRDGEKSSTAWGQTHPEFGLPGGNPTLVRGISPTFYDIDEKRDIFELDATHRIKATDFGMGLRYEHGDLNNARKISQFPGEPTARAVTDREGTSYDMFSAHAFTETWLKKNLFFSTGFLYSDLWGDFSGSRIYGDDFDVGYAPNALNGIGYFGLDGSLHKQEYVMNLNLMATPVKNLTIVPSLRVQKECWDADSAGFQTIDVNAPTLVNSDSVGTSLDVTERLDVRYSGITNWVLYTRGEWTEGDGNLDENGGMGTTTPIQRQTEDTRFFQKYSAGARWYPTRRLTVDAGGYYKNNSYDYDHQLDSTANNSANRYPAYLVMQNFETYDGNVRFTLRPFQKLTLVSRYEYQLSTIHTKPDSISGLSEVESSEMTSHIFAQNATWIPWSRLYLQAGFNYVVSETKTPASDFTQAILNAQNNYLTVNFNAGFVVNDKTDLNVGYFYYRADNFQDNSAAGLPLGTGAEEHGVTATIVRRISKNLRLTLRYAYFHYDEETYGGNNNYEAHTLFSSLQCRF